MLGSLLDPLTHTVLFTFGTDAVTWAEVLGFVTGLGTVYLTVRERVSLFPIGIANNIFFFILFMDARFYADAYLQLIYIGLSIHGWWAWLKSGPGHSKLPIANASENAVVYTIFGVIGSTAIMWPLLRNAHDIAPFWDALTTGLSLGAQVLLNLKKVQNWYFWMVADLIYIPLYLFKNLYLTSIVYVCFLGLCLAGLNIWMQRAPRRRMAV